MGQTHRKDGFCYGLCDRCGESFAHPARGQPYRYCSLECAKPPVWDRLLQRLVGSDEPGGCLVWTGKSNHDGYGEIQHEGAIWKVHRLVWTLTVGPIPEGLEVCHRCDNPACARVNHLFLGSHTDNMRDMARKGRGVYPDVRGEKHGASKLTDSKVRAIRRDRRTQAVIAESYGISQSLVSQVKRGKVWRHVEAHLRAA